MSLFDEIGKAVAEGRDPQEAVDAYDYTLVTEITPEALATARAYQEAFPNPLPWTDRDGNPVDIWKEA